MDDIQMKDQVLEPLSQKVTAGRICL